ncbi:hypothetical protein I553_4804 [Mycobacterium xenopi 4042]|uniref:Uncharacterized protein n=1 Tax=Mycobacterium xenopi 4042 TaxID=1299334 RepID=X8AF49_MYCXE|nr:hypothetical protein I553_4804 [Mycobacterium xenopi 4042]
MGVLGARRMYRRVQYLLDVGVRNLADWVESSARSLRKYDLE